MPLALSFSYSYHILSLTLSRPPSHDAAITYQPPPVLISFPSADSDFTTPNHAYAHILNSLFQFSFTLGFPLPPDETPH